MCVHVFWILFFAFVYLFFLYVCFCFRFHFSIQSWHKNTTMAMLALEIVIRLYVYVQASNSQSTICQLKVFTLNFTNETTDERRYFGFCQLHSKTNFKKNTKHNFGNDAAHLNHVFMPIVLIITQKWMYENYICAPWKSIDPLYICMVLIHSHF